MRTAEELYDHDSSTSTTTEEPKREAGASEEVAKPVEPKTSETQVEVKPEKQQVAKPVEKTGDEEDQEHVPDDLDGLKKALAAARGDKRKARKQWQETEHKLAELTGKIAVYQQHATQPKVDPVTPQAPTVPDLNNTNFFDPNEVKKYVLHQATSIEKKLERQFQDRSERAARKRHEDFEDASQQFIAAAQKNPSLWQQWAEDDDPGEFAYRTGKALKDFEGVGTIADFEAKVEARVRAKIEAERGTQVQPQVNAPQIAIKPPLPKSLATVRGTGIGVKPEWRPHTAEELYDQ